MGRLVVIVPLREGAYPEAQALLRQGPPLEPQDGAVERYWAFLSRAEAVLGLRGTGGRRERPCSLEGTVGLEGRAQVGAVRQVGL